MYIYFGGKKTGTFLFNKCGWRTRQPYGRKWTWNFNPLYTQTYRLGFKKYEQEFKCLKSIKKRVSLEAREGGAMMWAKGCPEEAGEIYADPEGRWFWNTHEPNHFCGASHSHTPQ